MPTHESSRDAHLRSRHEHEPAQSHSAELGRFENLPNDLGAEGICRRLRSCRWLSSAMAARPRLQSGPTLGGASAVMIKLRRLWQSFVRLFTRRATAEQIVQTQAPESVAQDAMLNAPEPLPVVVPPIAEHAEQLVEPA